MFQTNISIKTLEKEKEMSSIDQQTAPSLQTNLEAPAASDPVSCSFVFAGDIVTTCASPWQDNFSQSHIKRLWWSRPRAPQTQPLPASCSPIPGISKSCTNSLPHCEPEFLIHPQNTKIICFKEAILLRWFSYLKTQSQKNRGTELFQALCGS